MGEREKKAKRENVGKATRPTSKNASNSLGSGSLLALGVLVAAIAVYLSSPEGPQAVVR